MKLIKVTLNLAFLDSLNVSADAVRRTIFNQVNDGLEAEVCFTSDVEELPRLRHRRRGRERGHRSMARESANADGSR